MGSVSRQIKRHAKERRKAEQPKKPQGRASKLADRIFLASPVWVRRIVVGVMKFFLSPRMAPELVGEREKGEYPPAVFDLRFRLYPDGDVDYVNRWGNDIRVTDQAVIDMVHHEYNSLVDEARRLKAL